MSKRTLAEFEPLLAGEKTLLAGLSSGEFVEIGTTVPNVDAGEERQVRGEFLRYLLLGGCEGLNKRGIHVREKGVQIWGVLITGVLDLEGCRIPRDITLAYCRFQTKPVLRSAQIDNLFLNGSALPGLSADRLEAKGSVSLRDVVATGQVRLPGAKLGGDLSCSGAQLMAGKDGRVLSADGLEAKGNVFLRDVVTTGGVRLLGAKLGGDLDCDGAQLTAVKGGRALSLDRVRVEGAFFLRDKARINGGLDLTGATLGEINDEEGYWPDAGAFEP